VSSSHAVVMLYKLHVSGPYMRILITFLLDPHYDSFFCFISGRDRTELHFAPTLNELISQKKQDALLLSRHTHS